MFTIKATGVNDAYIKGHKILSKYGVARDSRAGKVVSMPAPVMTSYSNPRQRVLLDTNRKANPFFHLFEAIWMISGSNDAKWLDRFVSDFSVRFAEEDGTQHGAYGHRWRKFFLFDQLDYVVRRLKADPNDRRIVIQMWDPEQDLYDVDSEFVPRDVPCNTNIYPRIVDGKLDITVCCRSNDLIWGLFGSNVVHFSILQEFLAAKLGIPVGRYYHLSNDLHMYEATKKTPGNAASEAALNGMTVTQIEDPDLWEMDAKDFVSWLSANPDDYQTQWFRVVACPMLSTHTIFKEVDHSNRLTAALNEAAHIMSDDWRAGVYLWLAQKAMVKGIDIPAHAASQLARLYL